MYILVDYLTLTIKEYSLLKFLEESKLGLVPYEFSGGGLVTYEHSIYYGGIRIYYNGDINSCSDIFTVNMSGTGCRTFESLHDKQLDWLEFIKYYMRVDLNDYKNSKAHISRLDIACDDKPEEGEEPLLDFLKIRSHYENDKFICKAKKHTQSRGTNTVEFEQCIYFGSPRSDRRLRIYNKALERQQAGKDYDKHWIRVEFQLRNDSALSFFLTCIETGDIGSTFSGVLLDYLRFTTEVNKNDHNQGRLRVCKWWLNFCNSAEKIKLFKIGGSEYNVDNLCNYLVKQVGGSILTYNILFGEDKYDFNSLRSLLEDCHISDKQYKLIKDFNMRLADERLETLKKRLKEFGFNE